MTTDKIDVRNTQEAHLFVSCAEEDDALLYNAKMSDSILPGKSCRMRSSLRFESSLWHIADADYATQQAPTASEKSTGVFSKL